MRLRLLFVVGLVAALPLFAQVPPDVLNTITDAAAALANDDAPAFLDQFDSNMPGFADLRTNIEGLLGASQVVSTIEPISNQGDDRRQSVDLDWVLAINDKDQTGIRKETRRAIVKCQLEHQGKRWKIVALEPVTFFRP
jgi:hypothetical protein